ncbi:MAG: Dabb family protein [Spirosomaceae bacterium]|nr:Dabb family protein [Spirosomataceae bacterium]MDP5140503.1 Dabb family protein [Spirosomataceae bacterium]
MTTRKQGLVHTVFFWLKESTETNKVALHAGLEKLATIDIIREAYVGQPASTNREVIDNTYDFSITFIFDDKATQDVYQDHPDHIVFIKTCSHLWQKVQVYDAVS